MSSPQTPTLRTEGHRSQPTQLPVLPRLLREQPSRRLNRQSVSPPESPCHLTSPGSAGVGHERRESPERGVRPPPLIFLVTSAFILSPICLYQLKPQFQAEKQKQTLALELDVKRGWPPLCGNGALVRGYLRVGMRLGWVLNNRKTPGEGH